MDDAPCVDWGTAQLPMLAKLVIQQSLLRRLTPAVLGLTAVHLVTAVKEDMLGEARIRQAQ